MALVERNQVDSKHCWNVEALYPSWKAWEEDLTLWGREKSLPHWPELEALKESWKRGVEGLKKLLDTQCLFERHLSKLYTYAHLRHDEDVAEEVGKKAYTRATSLLHAFSQEVAWIEPALLAHPEEELLSWLRSSVLDSYRFYLERILRVGSHVLPVAEEELLARAGKSLESVSLAFGAFNSADLKFPPVMDSQGVSHELTHGKYQVYLHSQDRVLRKGAFTHLHQAFSSFENTLCELLSGQVQCHLLTKGARRYSSCVEAALFPNQIDISVYRSLIKAVRSRLPVLHRYLSLRKKVMGLDQLHLYDLSVPLVADVETKIPYEEAVQLILDSVAVLGTEYQTQLEKGLKRDRWVDLYENKRKRSGAYSSGCYDSMPYILMNYEGTLNDVMTLTHEAGHSMHSLLSRTHQPYHYAGYSIFVAEVASTFNEELLIRHLLSKSPSKEQTAFLINQKLDGLRGTLLRQTLFAEFELKLHEWAEAGTPLTPTLLKTEYRALSETYFGSGVHLDPVADVEWARIPHFYYNFYVYQYATGISAAHALVERVMQEGESAYLTFLSSGSSQYPLDLLKRAGVDMTTPHPVEKAMDYFDSLTSQLETLL